MEQDAVDVREIMRGIRLRGRAAARERAQADRGGQPMASPAIAMSVSGLERAIADIRQSVALIGALPPSPGTWRARASMALVKAVRRALFWFIPGLQSFELKVLSALEEQLAATRALNDEVGRLADEVAAQRRQSLKEGHEP